MIIFFARQSDMYARKDANSHIIWNERANKKHSRSAIATYLHSQPARVSVTAQPMI